MNCTPYNISIATGINTWTNQPAALTEFLGLTHNRIRVDLSDVNKIRLSVRISTVGDAGAILYAQYSTDESTWLNLTNVAPTNSTIAVNGSVGTKVSAWEDLPAGARGDVFIRLVGSGGNGVADPVIGSCVLSVR